MKIDLTITSAPQPFHKESLPVSRRSFLACLLTSATIIGCTGKSSSPNREVQSRVNETSTLDEFLTEITAQIKSIYQDQNRSGARKVDVVLKDLDQLGQQVSKWLGPERFPSPPLIFNTPESYNALRKSMLPLKIYFYLRPLYADKDNAFLSGAIFQLRDSHIGDNFTPFEVSVGQIVLPAARDFRVQEIAETLIPVYEYFPNNRITREAGSNLAQTHAEIGLILFNTSSIQHHLRNLQITQEQYCHDILLNEYSHVVFHHAFGDVKRKMQDPFNISYGEDNYIVGIDQINETLSDLVEYTYGKNFGSHLGGILAGQGRDYDLSRLLLRMALKRAMVDGVLRVDGLLATDELNTVEKANRISSTLLTDIDAGQETRRIVLELYNGVLEPALMQVQKRAVEIRKGASR